MVRTKKIITPVQDVINTNIGFSAINKRMITLRLNLYDYNHFPNILRFFDVLPNFLFITGETMCNYYL